MSGNGGANEASKPQAAPESSEGRDAARTVTTDPAASLNAALRRSLDEALRRASLSVPPPEERLIVEQVIQEVAVEIQRISGTYQGPMPPPPMMREFDNVVPGLAREIADAAHEERRHRHRWENTALWNDIFLQSGGLFLGWALAGGCALAAALLAWKGNNWGAAIMLSAPLVAMVRTIIHSDHHDGDERAEAPQESQGPDRSPDSE